MKGFTLIELLIVIAILAVLATTVAVVLNPAQMLKEARDSQRISDLSSIQSAISLYLASVTSPSIGAGPYCTYGTSDFGTGSCTTNATTTVDGNGWVAVNLSSIPTGSPLARLPLDPTNDSTYYYVYKGDATNLTFELNANMESTKYAKDGTADKESNSKDGGNNANCYEVGSDPGLDLLD